MSYSRDNYHEPSRNQRDSRDYGRDRYEGETRRRNRYSDRNRYTHNSGRSEQYTPGSGYGHFDNDRPSAYRSEGRGARSRRGNSFDDDGRISSVYRPAANRSSYSRSSNRYTSANASRRRAEQARSEQGHVQRNPNASRYSRDRYVRQGGQQRVMPVSQQGYAAARRDKPIDPRLFLVLGAVAALLLAIIVARIFVFSGTASEYHTLQSSISAEQTQIKELEASSGDLQTQMDSWQETIDKYNKSKK